MNKVSWYSKEEIIISFQLKINAVFLFVCFLGNAQGNTKGHAPEKSQIKTRQQLPPCGHKQVFILLK